MKNFPVLLVPAYNETHRFSKEYFLNLRSICSDLVIVFVNDGSTDATLKVLEATTKLVPDSFVIDLDEHVGKANAIREGFLRILEIYPNISWVGFVDADGSFLAEEIASTISLIAEAPTDCDAIFTNRRVSFEKKTNERILRIIAKKIVFTFLVLGWRQHPNDTQSGFKFFRITEALTIALATKFKTSWFFEWELLIRLRSKNSFLNILEVPIRVLHQGDGHIQLAKYPQIFFEILFIKLQQIRSVFFRRL